ncbi:MAG: hypothetical protein KGM24_06205 [Elusimicrobia bacterium]|nr:hypothetical protein [Elusimicrobiota bacterium]
MSIAVAALAYASLLVAEILAPLSLEYGALGFVHVWGPLCVFGGIGLGQLAYALVDSRGGRPRERLDLFNAALVLLPLYLLFGWAENLLTVWTVLVFAAFGVALGRLFDRHPTRDVIAGAAVAGVLTAAAFLRLSAIDAKWLKMLSFLLLLAAGWLESRGWRSSRRSLAAAALAALCALPSYRLTPKVVYYGLVRGLTPTGKVYYSPMIRTDVYTRGAQELLLTNGARVAVLPGADVPNRLFDLLTRGRRDDALVVGPAGGQNVARLLQAGERRVVAVDVNPSVFRAAEEGPTARDRELYRDPRVVPVVAEGRHFLERTNEKFELILMQTIATGSVAAAFGNYFESFLFTREALGLLWRHLARNGLIVITEHKLRWETLGRLRKGGPTFMDTVARTAACSPELKDARLYYFEHREQIGPAQYFAGRRSAILQTLMIAKGPIAADALMSEVGGRPRAIARGRCSDLMTDDRPFFEADARRLRDWALAILVFLAAAVALLRRGGRARMSGGAAGACLLAGSGFILWQISLSSLLFLLLPNPAEALPALFFLSFAAGLACYEIKLRPGAVLALSAVGAAYCLWAYAHLRAGRPSVPVLAGLGFPLFLFVELPYMSLLRSAEDPLRVVVYENLGSLAGVALGLLLRGGAGYARLTQAAVALTFASAAAFAVQRRRAGGADSRAS